jgi:hypothetical protein
VVSCSQECRRKYNEHLDTDGLNSDNMNMNSHSYTRAFSIGLFMWLAGTIGVRLAGQRVLHADQVSRTLILYLVSFLLMAWLIPRICRRLGLERESWFKATAALILPTLLLDPFSCVLFATAFPNVDPGAAGVFGGWMLICCGGAVAGVWLRR